MQSMTARELIDKWRAIAAKERMAKLTANVVRRQCYEDCADELEELLLGNQVEIRSGKIVRSATGKSEIIQISGSTMDDRLTISAEDASKLIVES